MCPQLSATTQHIERGVADQHEDQWHDFAQHPARGAEAGARHQPEPHDDERVRQRDEPVAARQVEAGEGGDRHDHRVGSEEDFGGSPRRCAAFRRRD
jgi:hypothetical protein